MNRDTAKTLSLVAMIFVIIALVMMVLYLGFYALMFLSMGVMMYDSEMSAGSATLCCFVAIMLIFLILPSLNCYFAYSKIYVPMRDGRFDDDVKKFVIVALVLSFLGGGGLVPAIMYIIILASWSEIIQPPMPYGMYPGYPPYPMYGAPPGQYPPYMGQAPPGRPPHGQMGQPPYRR